MKKFISTFYVTILVIIFTLFLSISASANSVASQGNNNEFGNPVSVNNAIIPPDEEHGYSRIEDMPFPTNNLLGTARLINTVVIAGNSENGQLYNVYKYDIPIYCLVGLKNSSYMLIDGGSSVTITYTETKYISTSYSEQVSNTNSLSLSSGLSTSLGFAGIEMEASISSSVTESLETTYGSIFTYATQESQSYTDTYNVTESGRYRLEKRIFLSVYVIQTYTTITSIGSGNGVPRVERDTSYYFHSNSIKLGTLQNGSFEIGLMRYNLINGTCVFDKDYYVRKFNNGDDNFIVL